MRKHFSQTNFTWKNQFLMNQITLFAFTCLLTISLTAQDRAKQFDSLFNKLYIENKFTGNVLIAENGKPVFQRSYGKAFREKNIDLDSESLFDLASVSKQFTAMGIMLLKKQGKLNYDDSLRKFFPELPYSNIRIRHLLQHTSGLPDYIDMAEKYWDNKKIMTNRDMIVMMAAQKAPVLFAAGEKWSYSNTGYALLASIIEKASGISFKDYLAASIFKPLGMSRTTVYRKRYEKKAVDNYAYGYVKDSTGKYVMADSLPATASMVYSLDGIYGDGVVNSTTNDLLKWDQALYTEKLVSKEMMQEAFTPAVLNNSKNYNYGFGWLLNESQNFGRTMYHSGGWPGYVTYIERHPLTNKTIILLANAGAANGSIKAIRNILYNIVEKPPVAITLDEQMLKKYVGVYLFEFPVKDSLHISLENGSLFASSASQEKHQLFAEAKDLFFRKGRDYKTKFLRDKEGEIIALNFLREGPTMEALKINK